MDAPTPTAISFFGKNSSFSFSCSSQHPHHTSSFPLIELFSWTFVRFSQYEMDGLNKGILKDSEAFAELIRILTPGKG